MERSQSQFAIMLYSLHDLYAGPDQFAKRITWLKDWQEGLTAQQRFEMAGELDSGGCSPLYRALWRGDLQVAHHIIKTGNPAAL